MCNWKRSCQICLLIREGDTFKNANDSRTFKIFSGPFHCNTQSVVYMLQCSRCNKKYVGSTKNKFRQRFNVYKLYFRTYARKHTEGSLGTGKPVPQASFFSHFLWTTWGNFAVTIKIIDKAEDVFSLRRKELFWQYKLGTFAPAGLNERAADIELDMFACGVAWTLPLYFGVWVFWRGTSIFVFAFKNMVVGWNPLSCHPGFSSGYNSF